jgi:hypothetical protein
LRDVLRHAGQDAALSSWHNQLVRHDGGRMEAKFARKPSQIRLSVPPWFPWLMEGFC